MTPGRLPAGSLQQGMDCRGRAAASVQSRPGSGGSPGSDRGDLPLALGLTAREGQAAGPAAVQPTGLPPSAHAMLAFLSLEDLPERLLLRPDGPVPWSWTLPLPLHSPTKEDEAPSPTSGLREAARGPSYGSRREGASEQPTVEALVRTALQPPAQEVLPLPWSWASDLSPESPRDTLLAPAASGGGPARRATARGGSGGGGPGASGPSAAQPLALALRGAKGDAPRILQLTRDAELAAAGDKRFLAEVYLAAVDSYGRVPEPPPEDFRDLCVKCMRALCVVDPREAREFHNRFRGSSAGRAEARLYEARAALEEKLGNPLKAVKMLQEGLRMGAEPPGMLRRVLARLELVVQQSRGATVVAAPDTGASTPPAGAPGQRDRRSASPRLRTPRRGGGPGAAVEAPAEEAEVQHGDAAEEVWEQQLQVRRLRQEAQRRSDPYARRSCPRCCRESVGGAVSSLMDAVLGVVDDALAAAPRGALTGGGAGGGRESFSMDGAWKEQLAEEVWTFISSTDLGTASSGRARAAAALPALAPLRARLRQALAAAAAQGQAEAPDGKCEEGAPARACLAEIPLTEGEPHGEKWQAAGAPPAAGSGRSASKENAGRPPGPVLGPAAARAAARASWPEAPWVGADRAPLRLPR